MARASLRAGLRAPPTAPQALSVISPVSQSLPVALVGLSPDPSQGLPLELPPLLSLPLPKRKLTGPAHLLTPARLGTGCPLVMSATVRGSGPLGTKPVSLIHFFWKGGWAD